MTAQGLIVGTGAIQYPPEYEAADPRSLADIARQQGHHDHVDLRPPRDPGGRVRASSSHYIHQLMLGTDRFYDEIFASLKIPYEPVRWSRDVSSMDYEEMLQKQSRVIQLINMYRVRGHLLADLNPIGCEVLSYPELDLSHYGLTVWDLDREFLTDGLLGDRSKMSLRGDHRPPARCLLRDDRHRVHAHLGARAEELDPDGSPSLRGTSSRARTRSTSSIG